MNPLVAPRPAIGSNSTGMNPAAGNWVAGTVLPPVGAPPTIGAAAGGLPMAAAAPVPACIPRPKDVASAPSAVQGNEGNAEGDSLDLDAAMMELLRDVSRVPPAPVGSGRGIISRGPVLRDSAQADSGSVAEQAAHPANHAAQNLAPDASTQRTIDKAAEVGDGSNQPGGGVESASSAAKEEHSPAPDCKGSGVVAASFFDEAGMLANDGNFMERFRRMQEEKLKSPAKTMMDTNVSAEGEASDKDAPPVQNNSPRPDLAADTSGGGGPPPKKQKTQPPEPHGPPLPAQPASPQRAAVAAPAPPRQSAAPRLTKGTSKATEEKTAADQAPREAWEYLKKDTWGAGNFFDFNSF